MPETTHAQKVTMLKEYTREEINEFWIGLHKSGIQKAIDEFQIAAEAAGFTLMGATRECGVCSSSGIDHYRGAMITSGPDGDEVEERVLCRQCAKAGKTMYDAKAVILKVTP